MNNNISIKSSELKYISDSACEILTLIRMVSKNAGADKTGMEYALAGITKLAQEHNDSLLDYVVDEENGND